MECFSVFNHKICALLDWDNLSECALDLPGDFKMVEDRNFVLVVLDNFFLFRRDK